MARTCNHPKWNIDNKNIGTCTNPKCQEQRQFPTEKGGEIVIVRPSKCNSASPREQRSKKAGAKKRNRSDNADRHRYYEKNREAITKDLLALGRHKTRQKWGIPSATLVYLEARWLSNEQRAHVLMHEPPYTKITDKDGFLPVFPAFNNDWAESVQLKWLDLYGQLRGIKHGNE